MITFYEGLNEFYNNVKTKMKSAPVGKIASGVLGAGLAATALYNLSHGGGINPGSLGGGDDTPSTAGSVLPSGDSTHPLFTKQNLPDLSIKAPEPIPYQPTIGSELASGDNTRPAFNQQNLPNLSIQPPAQVPAQMPVTNNPNLPSTPDPIPTNDPNLPSTPDPVSTPPVTNNPNLPSTPDPIPQKNIPQPQTSIPVSPVTAAPGTQQPPTSSGASWNPNLGQHWLGNKNVWVPEVGKFVVAQQIKR